jgi:hypothetical protein
MDLLAGAELPNDNPFGLVFWIPLITLLITFIGTFSTIFLGWRLDRRQAKELELKTKELELKIKELELKLLSAQKPPEVFLHKSIQRPPKLPMYLADITKEQIAYFIGIFLNTL